MALGNFKIHLFNAQCAFYFIELYWCGIMKIAYDLTLSKKKKKRTTIVTREIIYLKSNSRNFKINAKKQKKKFISRSIIIFSILIKLCKWLLPIFHKNLNYSKQATLSAVNYSTQYRFFQLKALWIKLKINFIYMQIYVDNRFSDIRFYYFFSTTQFDTPTQMTNV